MIEERENPRKAPWEQYCHFHFLVLLTNEKRFCCQFYFGALSVIIFPFFFFFYTFEPSARIILRNGCAGVYYFTLALLRTGYGDDEGGGGKESGFCVSFRKYICLPLPHRAVSNSFLSAAVYFFSAAPGQQQAHHHNLQLTARYCGTIWKYDNTRGADGPQNILC